METSTSMQEYLSDEFLEQLLKSKGLQNQSLVLRSITKRKESAGHYEITCDFGYGSYDQIDLYYTTTDMNLIDDWNEYNSYFEDDTNGHWLKSPEDIMQTALIRCIESDDNLYRLISFTKKMRII